MIAQKPKSYLTGIPHKLVALGLLSETDAKKAIEQSRSERIPFVTYVVNKKLVNRNAVARALSEEFGIPLIDLEYIELDPELIKLIDEKLLEKHKALPIFKRGNRLFVAVSDPTNLDALKEIQFHTNTFLVEDVYACVKADGFAAPGGSCH